MGKATVWPKKYLADDSPSLGNSVQDNLLKQNKPAKNNIIIANQVWVRSYPYYVPF